MSKTSLPILVFLLLMPTLLLAASEGELEAGFVNPGYHTKPAWFKESFLDIREDIEEAAGESRRVMLYFYQDGCPYCEKLLKDNFGNRGIAGKTQQHFDVIAINMWGDREVTGVNGELTTEKNFARDLEVQYTPTLLFLDESGAPVTRLNGYFPPHQFNIVLDYVAGRKEKEIDIRSYLAQQAPVEASGKLHLEEGFLTAPVDLSAQGEKPLLVLFEQKQCPECDELHLDIFQREPVRKSLDQYRVALLDLWSTDAITTPQGGRTTVSAWADALDIRYAPSMLIFDSEGSEVFRTEAYLKAFHVHGALDYVLDGDYLSEPEFQRYLQVRREEMEARGIKVDMME
ncbi:MAG: thioredoxin fold domain-containing protein [Chromatiales bacterium]|jgi:thioredoxin-related protein